MNVNSMHFVNSPQISIVMAAYNEAGNIGQAIESLISQTFTNWELIIVDDGSTDETADVVRRFVERDNRIRLISNDKNVRLPASLNRGIALAKAGFIARADADDWNMPERLERQYTYMLANPDVDVLGTGAELMDKNNNCVHVVSLPLTHGDLQQIPFLKTHFFHPSVMIRKRFFEKAGFYDSKYLRAEDKELWLRGLRSGCRYANLPEPLIKYQTDNYVRSWKSLFNSTLSLLILARIYNVRSGYSTVLLSFLHRSAIKLSIYKPKSLRQGGSANFHNESTSHCSQKKGIL